MHTIFKAMAEYNKNVNAAVCGHIRGLSAEQYGRRLNAYYPTIPDTLFHVMSSDAKWLGRLAAFHASSFDTAALEDFRGMLDKDPAGVFAQREKLFSLRGQLDTDIIGLIRDLESVDLTKITAISFGGGRLELELWKLLLQWFNHHTHHRGQISLHLDMLGVENDFSMVLGKI